MLQKASPPSTTFYDREAPRLFREYASLDPEVLYPSIVSLLPSSPAAVLDVAAGSGRDVAWLRSLGHAVTAVEPSQGMRDAAAAGGNADGIDWIDSSLPDLAGVDAPAGGFEFILCAAVWMHLEPAHRPAAWRRLASLAARGASVLVTLRHGPGEPERPMHPIDTAAEAAAALDAGFSSVSLSRQGGADLLGRSGITWEHMAAHRAP